MFRKCNFVVEHFSSSSSIFVVFASGGPTLRQVMDDPSFRPLSKRQIKEIALQVVRGVSCMSSVS